jgi:thiamine biosynthesis lipoprotein
MFLLRVRRLQVFQSVQISSGMLGGLRVLVACMSGLGCGGMRADPLPESLERFVFEKAEMGVPFRVTLYARGNSEAQLAAQKAFARVSELNAVFSDYDSDSELSVLCESSGKGNSMRVGVDLWTVLERALYFSKKSDGAFDISVGPLVNLWRTARRKRTLPAPDKIREALGRTGYSSIRLDEASNSVELLKSRMRLDAGGIAKGYAIQEALKVLVNLGHKACMVEGGGDLAVGDAPPGAAGWRVSITALDHQNAPAPQVLEMTHQALSTSGDLYQRLEIDGVRYSHIVDPRTGVGLVDHSLVSVLGPNAMDTDALSKVIAVLGPERGIPIAEQMEGVSVYVIRAPEGQLEEWRSANWAR